MASCGTYVAVTLAVLVTLVIYVLYPVVMSPKERFEEEKKVASLANPSNLVVFQGSALPDVPPKPMEFDQHPSLPAVDGKNGPRSMFMMAFNKCDPSCCPSTYSCGGGCVCMTDEQRNFLGNRGNNGNGRKGNQKEF